MAVIVQVMIPAEFSGVLFTIDPLHKNKDNMVIEITPGLGNGAVSGKTMPLYITINRHTGMITASTHFMVQSCDGCITHINWKSLLDFALKIEDTFNSPQDIEWAYNDHKFWILQSRPITVPSLQTCRNIWTLR
jgi:pyruvate,water dikinase